MNTNPDDQDAQPGAKRCPETYKGMQCEATHEPAAHVVHSARYPDARTLQWITDADAYDRFNNRLQHQTLSLTTGKPAEPVTDGLW